MNEREHRGARRWRWFGLATVTLGLAAACGKGEKAAESAPTTPPAVTTERIASEPAAQREVAMATHGTGGVVVVAPASVGSLTAAPVADLQALKNNADGGGLVAAARFGPEGAAFPDGVAVTFPIAADEDVTPGARLWIVTLDEQQARWLNTRQRATVADNGKTATGRMYHFSTAAVTRVPPDQDDAKTPHAPTNTAFVRTEGHHAVKVDPKKAEAVKQLYADTGGQQAPMTKARTQALYGAGDYATLKTLIEKGVISPQHSMDMADMRLLMVMQTWEHIIKTHGKGKWRIYRSDSGNQKAGMASDMDQTVKVMEFKDGKWVRAEHLDWAAMELFRKEFPGQTKGLSIESMDIATIAARDNPPDWRTTAAQLEAEGKRDFARHTSETMFTLRRTPGAYTYTGAIVQQMQLRVLDLIEKNLVAGKDAPRPAEPRPIHAELAAHNPEFRLNNMVFLAIGPDDNGAGEVKAREVYQEEAVAVMFDGLKPKLIRGHAYDAAVANYFEYMHHVEDKFPAVKYHLRALDDGLHAIERLRSRDAKREYASIAAEERFAHLEKLLGKDLGVKQWDGKSFIDRWKSAFDISSRMRDLHSRKQLNDTTYAESLQPLIAEMYGEKGTWTNQEHVSAARAEYTRRVQEFLLHNMIQTSEQRIGEFLCPAGDDAAALGLFKQALDESALRKRLGLDHPLDDRKWQGIREEMIKNYAEQARNQLLYSLRDLRSRPDVLRMILDRAKAKGYTATQLTELNKLVAESGRNGLFFGYSEFKKFPKTYLRYAQLATEHAASKLAAKAWEGLKSDLGFIEMPAGPRPSNLLKTLGMHGLHERTEVFLKKNPMLGRAERRFGHAFLQIGVAQGAANVLRAYSDHDGDPLETTKAVLRESAMLLFPHLGMAYGAYEAGTDLKQQALLILCMVSPAGGVVMVAFTVGEAGIALYENEYVEPLKNLTADAIYRGYVGPSLYDFSQEGNVPPFTDEQEQQLGKLLEKIAMLRKRIESGGGSKGDAQVLAETGRDAKPLQMHKSAWKAFDAETKKYQGSALSGAGKVLEQRVLELGPVTTEPFRGEPIGAPGALLGRVKPVIFYSRDRNEGAVDFTQPKLTPQEEQRRRELEATIPEMQDPIATVDLESEYHALDRRRKQSERAERYLAAAVQNHELMLQIRRDSMYPSMLQDQGIAKMYDAKNFVESWIAMRRNMLPEALALLGLQDSLEPWDERVRDELQERVWADLDRSKRLWLGHQMLTKALAEAEKQAIESRKGAIAGEMFMNAVGHSVMTLSPAAQAVLREAGIDPGDGNSTGSMGWAILDRHLPETPPQVDVRVRALPVDDEKTRMQVQLVADVKVTANQAIYVPPYFSVPYILDPKQAQQAAAAKSWMGLPLSDDMVERLRAYLEEVAPMLADFKPDDDPFDPAMLVFVFCTDVSIPERIVPDTVAELPRLVAYDIRTPNGMDEPPEGMRRGFLLGGAVGAAKAENVPSGPLQIATSRWPKSDMSATAIEILSKALGELDETDRETGLKFKILRSLSAAGPFEEFNEYIAGIVFGDTKVWAPSEQQQQPWETYRKSRDTLVLKEHITADQQQQLGNKPVYYQVVQIPVRGRSDVKEIGKEVKSNIASPGSEAELILWYEKTPDGSPKAYTDGRFSMSGKLALKSQYFDAAKPHMVYACGGRTLHAWGSASVEVLIPLGGGTVAVTGDGDGLSASASVSVQDDPARAEQMRAALESTQKELDRYNTEMPQRIAAAKKQMDDLGEPGPPEKNDVATVANWSDGTLRQALARRQWRIDAEYEYPRLQNMCKRNAAWARGDYAVVIACHETDLKLADIYYAGLAEHRAAVQKILDTLEASTMPDATFADFKQRQVDAIKPHAQAHDATDLQHTIYGLLRDAAWLAGDAGRYQDAVGKLVQIASSDPARTFALSSVNAQAADQIVKLTGDRSRGAEYYDKAMEVEIARTPANADQIRTNHRNNRPPWWPDDRR